MTRRGRCKRRRKSMAGGKGTAEIKNTDNDCGSPNLKEDIAKKPLVSPEITGPPSSSTVPLDLYTQARKTLSFRSPCDPDDSSAAQAFVSTANNLPTGVSNLLSWHSESRKRHKKLHSKTEKKSSASTKIRTNSIWPETEDYFRELTVEDVERLERFSHAGVSCDESLLLTPCLDEDSKFSDRQETISRILANDCLKDINELMLLQNDHHLLDGNAVATRGMDIRPNKSGDDWPTDQGPSNSFSGVEWLLGCRNKVYFSSDRPSKKRKLSGRDGLEKLYTALPVDGEESLCHYCSYGDVGGPLNILIKCSSCGMVVHQRCYGVQEVVDRCWLCSWCKFRSVSQGNAESQCLLCPKQGGALKPVNVGGPHRENDNSKVEFAHLFCCLWAHESYVENTDSMEPVMNVNEPKDTRKRLVCSLCKIKGGTCVRCSAGSCRNSFHPICAREARHRLEIWGKPGSDEVELHAYCFKHSEIQCDDNCPGTGDSSLTSDCVSNGYGEHSKESEGNLEPQHENGADMKTSNPCSIINFNMLLRKLIDLGKVNAEIVATEIGVAPHSLKKILDDKDTDPTMQSKVVRWLINNAHFGNFQKILKQRIQSLLAVKDYSGSDSVSTRSGADSRNSFAVPVRSEAPYRRKKGSSRSVKDDSSGASKDILNDFDDQGDSEKMLVDLDYMDTAANDPSGNEVKLKALAQCFNVGGVSEEARLMQLMTSPSVLKIGDMSCASYMHPTVYGKLMEAKSGILQQPESSQAAVSREREDSQAPSGLGLCCNNPTLLASSADITSECDRLNLDQLKSLRNSGIFGLAPVDEVEGELMYYQQKLINMTVLRKHLSDDLISKVVRILPEEIANVGERKWDAVLVNQYNHNQREAKKQGRKERRHKEAQAVLAAATAAAAASSRLSSNRKDNLEESPPQEDILKIRLLDSRSARQSLTRSSENSDTLNYTRTCDVCHRCETMLNPVLLCSGCKVSVHLDCYRSDKNTVGPWYCELCEEFMSSRSSGATASDSSAKLNFVPECALCGGTAGAFRKSADGQWMHALCAEWIFNSTYRRGQATPVEGIDSFTRGSEVCIVCSRKQGACLKCCYGHCHTSFHPTCARSAGFYMTVRTSGGKPQHKAYCEKHSVEQRAKAGIQKHGIEELKGLKQIRVELEKLRLLCERIVKREKLKRELVICSHDVLASSRDSALSVLARHPFYQPEVSSESATTFLKAHTDDYRSCSGMAQRADDITVDCTVAGKRRVRLPVSVDNDHKTDDTSPFPGKPGDHIPFSGSQISQRLPVNQSFDLVDKDERQSKVFGKQAEAFGNETMSEQGSMKNHRLP